LKDTGQSLSRTAESIRALTADLDRQVGPLSASLRETARHADDALGKATVTLDRLNDTLRPDAPLLYQANNTLIELSATARAVRQLADYLDRNPDAIVRGRSFEQGGK
jgi:ABC-type transporter Mla subunit MlaD